VPRLALHREFRENTHSRRNWFAVNVKKSDVKLFWKCGVEIFSPLERRPRQAKPERRSCRVSEKGNLIFFFFLGVLPVA
jgi:hypothetical protein